VIVGGVVAVAAAAGVFSVGRATRAAQSVPTIVQKQQTAVQRISHNSILLKPSAASPAITAEAAWKAVEAEQSLPKQDQITATLASITTEQSGETRTDGTIDPMYKDLLAWVIEAPEVELVPPLGPAPAGGLTQQPVQHTLCPAFFFVDATTGQPLFARQDC